MAISAQLETALSEKREFRFGEYISQGIDLFKKDPWSFMGYFFVIFLIAIFGVIVWIIPILGTIAHLVALFIIGQGGYLYAHKLANNQPVQFGDFFGGFKDWKTLARLSILVFGISLLCALPVYFYLFQRIGGMYAIEHPEALQRNLLAIGQEGYGLGYYLLQIPNYVISPIMMLSPLFVLFHGTTAREALHCSYTLAIKHIGWLILFNIVWGILIGLGILAFCIGMFAAASAYFCSIYTFFAEHTDLNKASEDNLLRHFTP